MKTKLVLWAIQATNEQPEEKVLLALELHPDDNKVTAWVFGGEAATTEFYDSLMNQWRKGEAVAFPESATKFVQDLSASSNLLPDTLRPEREELLKRTQTEWLFIVLSTKLYRAYLSELEELHEGVNKLEFYDKNAWDGMKAFWDKVQTQINEQNLFREHAELLRERTNAIFAQMKQLRSAEDTAFETEARKNYDDTVARLVEIEAQVGSGDTGKLFETLKDIQKEFKNLKLTRQLRTDLWNRIDDAFKVVKGKKAGNNTSSQANGSPETRLSRRIEGLKDAIAKMEESIQRDQQELDIQNRKINSPESGQLETQLRGVRAKLIQERIDSKNVKLEDMRKTLSELSNRASKLESSEAETVASEEADGDDSQITTL